jgi:hypothetical protein
MPKPNESLDAISTPAEKPPKKPQTAALRPKPAKSALADFVERSMPSEDEEKKFEAYVKEEVREQEIESGLSEIYQDEKKGGSSIRTFEKIKRRGLIYKIFSFLVGLSAVIALAWLAYYFIYVNTSGDLTSVSITIAADKEILAGKEFFYTVTYKNLDRVDINNLTVDLTYPDNFIFLDAEPKPSKDQNSWKFAQLPTRRSGEIRIKGKLIGEAGSQAIIIGSLTYQPANISSNFKKETSSQSTIAGLGLALSVESASSALVGETNEIDIKYRAEDENYLTKFRLSIDQEENLEFDKSTASGTIPGNWQITDIGKEERDLKIKFKFKDKLTDTQDLNLKFEYSEDGLKYYPFLTKKLTYDVQKRDLNLTLIINGARTDQGVNFGQTMNYSIVYNNKGKTVMKDVVIMIVMDSDFLDWTSLNDKNKGKVSGKTISWSKTELPALAELSPGNEGTIDFSIKLQGVGEIDPTKNYQVKSFAQFSLGLLPAGVSSSTAASSTDAVVKQDGQSNVIISKFNSDLTLSEQVRYFNDDNIAVGSGPVPPKVGQTTSYKIYWVLTNNLNELYDVVLSTTLPAGVSFDQKSRTTLGTLDYDQATNKIVWNLGRLPITVYKSEAEFNLSITPTAADVNKILVLLAGTDITASDSVTNSPISKKTAPKTTKLDDDPAITDDGRVVP